MAQETANVLKGGECQVGKFGCNGAAPQAAATVGAALADITGGQSPTEAEFNALNQLVTQLRAAVVGNGIAVTP